MSRAHYTLGRPERLPPPLSPNLLSSSSSSWTISTEQFLFRRDDGIKGSRREDLRFEKRDREFGEGRREETGG